MRAARPPRFSNTLAMLLTPRARLCRYNASESVRPSPPGSTAAFGTGISVRARGGIRASQCARAVLDDELQRAQSDQALAYDGPGREYGPVGPKGAKVEKARCFRARCCSGRVLLCPVHVKARRNAAASTTRTSSCQFACHSLQHARRCRSGLRAGCHGQP